MWLSMLKLASWLIKFHNFLFQTQHSFWEVWLLYKGKTHNFSKKKKKKKFKKIADVSNVMTGAWGRVSRTIYT